MTEETFNQIGTLWAKIKALRVIVADLQDELGRVQGGKDVQLGVVRIPHPISVTIVHGALNLLSNKLEQLEGQFEGL